jgi:hypothetical protein
MPRFQKKVFLESKKSLLDQITIAVENIKACREYLLNLKKIKFHP